MELKYEVFLEQLTGINDYQCFYAGRMIGSYGCDVLPDMPVHVHTERMSLSSQYAEQIRGRNILCHTPAGDQLYAKIRPSGIGEFRLEYAGGALVCWIVGRSFRFFLNGRLLAEIYPGTGGGNTWFPEGYRHPEYYMEAAMPLSDEVAMLLLSFPKQCSFPR